MKLPTKPNSELTSDILGGQQHFIQSNFRCLCMILMIITFQLTAQKSYTDSLKKALLTARGEEKENLYSNLIFELLDTDLKEAKKQISEMENLPGISPTGKVKAMLHKATAIRYESPGNQQVIELLNKALEESFKIKYEKGIKTAIYDLTDYLNERGETKAAEDIFNKGFEYAEKTGNKNLMAVLFRQQGISEYYKGQLEKAMECFQKSIDIFTILGDMDEVGGLTMNLGVMTFRMGKTSESLSFYNKALKVFEKNKDSLNIANAIQNIALSESKLGNEEKAIKKLIEVVSIYEKKKDYFNMAGCYDNIGSAYVKLGNRKKAMEYYLKAAELNEKHENFKSQISNYLNIGEMYSQMRDTVKAIEYIEKSKSISLKINNEYLYSHSLTSLGILLSNRQHLEKAKKLFEESIAIGKKLNDLPGVSNTLISLGNIAKLKRDLTLAIKYYKEALTLKEQIEDIEGIAGITNNLGVVLYDSKKYSESITYFKKALKIRQDIKNMEGVQESYLSLSNSYKQLSDYKNAYDYLSKYHKLWDTLFNTEITKQITEMNTKYETEKKDKEITMRKAAEEIANSKADKASLEKKSAENKLLFSIIALILVLSLSGYVIYSNIQRKKANIKLAEQNEEIKQQKTEIEVQKHLVDEKQKEILDSITYAKRLQEAILPPLSTINNNTKESFVLYKPKDIVAGDFYWAEKNENLLYIAAADCTGHGVPGALVSVVCSNALNRSVKEFNISEPGKILDKTRELVLETFEKSGSDVKDGMDISLLCINTESQEVYWSGANNSLCYISNNKLFEIKANKQPVGKTEKSTPFTTHKINIEKDTVFYLFTDGFADQFGGIKGKKFKYKQLQEAFVKHHQAPLNEQKEIFINEFESWKGDLEQIDDVCIIGIKI